MGAIASCLDAVRARGPRYLAVAVANLLFGQALLLVAVTVWSGSDRWLVNAATVAIAAGPAYHANRTWVWDRRGPSDLRREIVPFWIFVAAGLVLTTGAVAMVEAGWSANGGRMPGPVTNVVNLAVIGVLWVVRFFWMDRAFAEPSISTGGVDELPVLPRARRA